MAILYLVGLLAWLAPTLVGIWFLYTFREMTAEIKSIRRYVQALHDRPSQPGRSSGTF